METNPQKQRGAVNSAVIIIVGVLATIGVLVALFCIGAQNMGNAFEQKVKYEHTNNRTILANYGKKIAEASQVPAMARDDIIKVAKAAMEGRYGADGSKAVFQAIQEKNAAVDPELYRALQRMIEAGRNEFQTSQTRLLDVKRSYETALGSIPKGSFMRFMGYPKVPLDTYNVVTSDRAEQAFETGREEPLQLRAP